MQLSERRDNPPLPFGTLTKAQAGDKNAFGEIVTRYERLVFTIAYRMTGSRDDALDITQDVFIKLYKNIGKVTDDSKLKSFVTAIAGNAAIDELRRKKRRPLPLTQPDGYESPVADSEPTPEEAAIISDDTDRALKALEQMTEDYRLVLILKDMKDYSYEEIAQSLNINMGTVKSRLSRARVKLKELFFAAEHRE